MSKKTRVLILGGGFGGLYAALQFEKRRDPRFEVTVVNRENFFLFTPMLHEIAASDLDLTNIVNPVRKMIRRVNFFCGDVDKIDIDKKQVVVSHGFDRHSHTLEYDHLVLALGSVTNFFNLPGVAERALTMKSLGDAIQLRNRLIAHLEEADTECARAERPPLLTFVVAGGGFAGVETIASINDFLRDALLFYPNLKEEMLRLVLVHPGEYLLPELGEKLGRYAERKLRERKVEVLKGARVAGYDGLFVTLANGEGIPAATLIWTAGVKPSPAIAALPCRKERGRLAVNEFLAVPEFPNVWAAGDCAAVLDAKTGTSNTPTAQHGLREGVIAAKNIEATILGKHMKPFKFKTFGQLATIGHHTGVATILGMKFSGFIAWLMWRTVYLLKLPRLPKKLRVVTGWTLDLVFSRDLEQMLTMRDVEAMSQMAGRVRKLVAEGSTTTSLTERRSTPVFLEARRTPEEELD